MTGLRAHVVGCLFTAHLVLAACSDSSNVAASGRPSSGGASGSVTTTSSGTSDASDVAGTSSVASTSGAGGRAGAGGTSGVGGAPGGASGAGGEGIVYFSNDGTVVGWSSARPQGNTIGKVVDVTSPVYKTSTAILTEQTYVQPQGAHSEVVLGTAQKNGEDKYYGQAIYLPLDWNTIDKNATFQQFSPESPAGPWMLNWIQNDHIFIRVGGTHYDCGLIAKGVWTKVVVRFKTTNPGIFEYWVDGVKKQSVTNVDLTILNGSPTMRWSTGIYVTWWRTDPPGPQLTRQIFHDQLRVASTYEDAEPANWGGP
jgi:hypothetical protein